MTDPASPIREADVELVARIVCRRECARLNIPPDACAAGGCAAWVEWQEAACEIIAALVPPASPAAPAAPSVRQDAGAKIRDKTEEWDMRPRPPASPAAPAPSEVGRWGLIDAQQKQIHDLQTERDEARAECARLREAGFREGVEAAAKVVHDAQDAFGWHEAENDILAGQIADAIRALLPKVTP